ERAGVDLVDDGAARPLGTGGCGLLELCHATSLLQALTVARPARSGSRADQPFRTTLSGGSPASIRSIWRRTRRAMRGRMALEAPPTCGLISRPGAPHSG